MKLAYDFSLPCTQQGSIQLADYRGKFILVVNTASRCGFTQQYQGLEQLQRKYKENLVVICCPCNQFAAQEPGSNRDIAQFCQTHYDSTFLLSDKISVRGKDTHPLFAYLQQSLPGILGSTMIKWNFTKFLIDRQGQPIGRFSPRQKPEEIEQVLKQLL